MKKIRKIFIAFNLIFLLVLVCSCGGKKSLEGIVSFDGASYTYDGEEHSLLASNLPDGVSVTYDNNTYTDAGRYVVTASFDGGKRYKDLDISAILTIYKADVTDISFNSTSVTYDSNPHTIEASNLPSFIDVSYKYYNESGYEVSECVNAGDYTIVASFTTSNKNYNAPSDMAAILSIEAIEEGTYTMRDTTCTYDGLSHKISVNEEIPEYLFVSYTYFKDDEEVLECVDAGKYKVVASFTTNNTNYSIPEDVSATLIIEKASLDASMDDMTYLYDGSSKALAINEDISDSFEVSYTYKDSDGNIMESLPVNVGSYTVVASFTNKSSNYNDIASLEASLTIIESSIEGISFNSESFTYDGSSKSIYITGDLPSGVSVTYSGNGAVNAGSYVVAATLTDSYSNYETITICATITIEKADYSEGITLEDASYTYDGEAKGIEIIESLPEDITVTYTYRIGNSIYEEAILPGSYTVIASFTTANYNEIESISATLTINKISLDVSLEDAEYVYDSSEVVERVATITKELPSGVSVSYTYTMDGESYSVASGIGLYTVVAYFSSNYTYYDLTSLTATIKIGYLISIDTDNDTSTIEYSYIACDVLDLIDYLDNLELELGDYAIESYSCYDADDNETELLVTDFDDSTEISSLEEIYEGLVFADLYIPCTVIFEAKGNAENAAVLNSTSVVVKSGRAVSEPTIITNATNSYGNYYSFVGWYSDEDCTTLYDFSSAVTSNITIYSKWEILEIATADDLEEYLSKSSTCNAYLSSNIDMTNNTLTRDSSSLVDSFGQFAVTLSHNFYGNGYTISNITIEASIDLAGMFGVLNGGGIYDLIIDTVSFTTTAERASIIAGTAKTNLSIISGVVIKNANISATSEFGLIVGNAQADLSISNVVASNTTISGKSTLGGIIGNVSSSVDIEIDSVLLNISIIGSGSNAGFIIAAAGSSSDITITNVVVGGSLSSAYAGSIISNGSAASKVSIENALVVEALVTATSVSDSINVIYYTIANPIVSNAYYSNLSATNGSTSLTLTGAENVSKSELQTIIFDGFSVEYSSDVVTYTLYNQSIAF